MYLSLLQMCVTKPTTLSMLNVKFSGISTLVLLDNHLQNSQPATVNLGMYRLSKHSPFFSMIRALEPPFHFPPLWI